MIIFKRDLKRNFKYFTIWTAFMCLMFIYMAVLYPTMMEQSGAMEKMLEGFPEGLIKALNFDLISNFKDVTYFFASEPFVLCFCAAVYLPCCLPQGFYQKRKATKP
jgi:ABC-2 type transport system permease protein